MFVIKMPHNFPWICGHAIMVNIQRDLVTCTCIKTVVPLIFAIYFIV